MHMAARSAESMEAPMGRCLKQLGASAGWVSAILVLSLLIVCPLAAQDFGFSARDGDLPLHSKVSSQDAVPVEPAPIRGQPWRRPRSNRAERSVGFREDIDAGPELVGPEFVSPESIGPGSVEPQFGDPQYSNASPFEENYSPDGMIQSDGMPYLDGCVQPGCVAPNYVSQERRWYMERHFGPGSVSQADCMTRFEPSYSCIDNNCYAPVEPPSPFMPLGGDSPIQFPWFHKPQAAQQPVEPFEDQGCPDCAPAPENPGSSWFPGTGWYQGSSPCYKGNCFKNYPCMEWLWKHNTAQYMWENIHLFAGPQGFKSPTDLFQDGNFGFHEGLNWGMPVWDDIGLGYQKGFEITQNNWNGTSGSGLLNHYRSQVFVTAGLFHRPIRGVGIQGGMAIDFLDENYYAKTHLTQIRGEISYLGPRHNEIGFFTAQHINTSNGISPLTLQPTTFQATDQYNVFVRRNFASGANGRIWGGVTGHGDGLVGGDATIYLSDRWAMTSAFNYLIPKQNSVVPATFREDLALTINLMWWPGYRTPASRYNPYRQLFSVADNTTFLITSR
jgi:hypothetical protein